MTDIKNNEDTVVKEGSIAKESDAKVEVQAEVPGTEPIKSDAVAMEETDAKKEIKNEETECLKTNAVATENQNGSTAAEAKNENIKLCPEVADKIVKQVEYYFGNYNLPRDKFLTAEVKKDDGWVSLDTMCTFKRLATLTTDHSSIMQALKSSTIIEINEADFKIRRSPLHPLPDLGDDINAEMIKRTIYLKGCKKDNSVTLDMLLEFFKQYGTYEAIKMRQYSNKVKNTKGFKGSILVIYPTVDAAKKLMGEDEIIFQNAPLLRKWYADYLEEKKKEIEDRKIEKAAKQAKRDAQANEDPTANEKDPEPTGTFLHIGGIPKTTSREDIKETLSKQNIDVAFVGLSRGDEECYLRLGTPFTNLDAVATLKGKMEIGDTEATVRAVVGPEEIEQLKLARKARSMMVTNSNKRKRDGGRSGFRGGRGGYAKKRKHC